MNHDVNTVDKVASNTNVDVPPPSYEEVAASVSPLQYPTSSNVGLFYPQVPPEVSQVHGAPAPYLIQLSPYTVAYHGNPYNNHNLPPPGFTNASFTHPHIPHVASPMCVGVLPRNDQEPVKRKKWFLRCIPILIMTFSIVIIIVMAIYHNNYKH